MLFSFAVDPAYPLSVRSCPHLDEDVLVRRAGPGPRVEVVADVVLGVGDQAVAEASKGAEGKGYKAQIL